jgi:tetratricopeptide (TPR) repeat protein
MILGLYLKLFLFPHPLVSDYSYQQIQLITFSDWRFLVSFVLLAGLFVFALKNIRRRDVLTFGILFFFITASVVSNVFAIIGTSMAERLMYAPSFGFAMATGVLLVRILKADENRLYLNLTQFFYSNGRVFLLTAVILILYSFKTITRNSDWENNYTLYTADVQNSPNSARTHYYLGNYLVKNEYLNELDSTARSKALDRAVSELHQAIKLFPQFADAYNELGKAYIEKKDLQNAGKNYKTAIDINPTNPTYHNNYGTILFQTGKYDEAISEFHEAIKWNPCYADALSNLGSCYGTAGKFDDAITYFKKAIGCDPAYASAYYFLGMTYRYKKDETNAQQYLNKAYDLNPALKKK